MLVNADTNTLEAIRAISLPTELLRKLHAAIHEQLTAEITEKDYEHAIQSAHKKWPNPEMMRTSR
jgi:hypothetical protein